MVTYMSKKSTSVWKEGAEYKPATVPINTTERKYEIFASWTQYTEVIVFVVQTAHTSQESLQLVR